METEEGQQMDFVIRAMQKEDAMAAAELEKRIFSVPWSEKSFLDAYASPDNIYLAAVSVEKIYGYCGIWISYETADLCNIAVAPECRREGIAEKMLRRAVKLSKERGVMKILLEVRQSNHAAICLYRKLGFAQIGVRRGYYHAPEEDALLMQLPLSH